ncbi:MAG: HAMP domain-containing sensor histidine kinase [Polyangiaceae bacterium]|nr:HAMP domain-containing sensor histidine kinase [Polyangiaceae bacterium]
MKTGLRLGVLLLLGVVTLLAFVPLFFAISAYTEVAFQRLASSEALKTAPGAHAAEFAAPLLRSIALYMGLFALVLLGASYVALTYFLVRPLDELGRAARRVAEGARQFSAPAHGPAELLELNRSLGTMTHHLVGREEALQLKIAEVERATENLREAQERLIRSERLASVGRLAAGLAHEIGNPISAILGLQELILSGHLQPQEQRDFVERMRKETERIHHILRDLLQFARPTQSSAEKLTPGDVTEAIRDTLALIVPQSAFKGIVLKNNADFALPRVTCSHEQLVQVLLNLLLNAADACGSTGEIRVTATQVASNVRIAVEDSGPGVHAGLGEQIFEPFVTTKEVGKGTGLGLAVCRGLVEACQGSISVDRTFKAGARFVVELPVVPSPASA